MKLPATNNNIYTSESEARTSPVSEFSLAVSDQYQYLFNFEFTEPTYDPHRYQNEQALSPFFRNHLLKVAEVLADRFGTSDFVCEVGCGKGSFLEILEESGFDNIVGFDRAYEGDNPKIIKDYLSVRYQPLNADVVVLRHVLEHISDPIRFLNEVEINNGQPCKFVIEVPSADWILKSDSFWDFTAEHANYFTKESFRAMFGNLELVEMFGGQYLLALCESSNLRINGHRSWTKSTVLEKMIMDSTSAHHATRILRSGRYWVWGGSAKGVMLLFHLSQLLGTTFHQPEAIIDINPAKQGSYAAVTGIPIVAPSRLYEMALDGDTVLVVNPNYEHEVRAMIKTSCDKSVTVVSL